MVAMGMNEILLCLGKEATEIILAAKDPESEELKFQISDFLYNCMILMVEKGVTWDEIANELAQR